MNDVFPQIPEITFPFEIRKPFHRSRSPLSFEGIDSVTDQTFGNDTDVNKIIARCRRTGEELPDIGPGQFADCTNLQKDLTVLIDEAKQTLDEYAKHQAEQNAKVERTRQSDAEKAKQFDELMKKQAEIQKPPAKQTED